MIPPVHARGGFTAVPNELLAAALASLTLEQFRLLMGLLYEAEFKREGSTAAPWRVGFGQVLVSYEGLSRRYDMSVDTVRRALRRFAKLGVTTARAQRATADATATATFPATSAATPPTIVDFGRWASFLGSARDPATSPATSPATGPATEPAPIQHGNTEHDLPPIPPRKRGGNRAERGEADLRRRAVVTAIENAGLFLNRDGKDDAAVDRLVALRATPAEIRRRLAMLPFGARPETLVNEWDRLRPVEGTPE